MGEVLLQSPYELHGSSLTELVYEVTVPFDQKIRPLTRLLGQLDGQNGMSVKWEIKKYETVPPQGRTCVNDLFPWAQGSFMPPCLLEVLPSLPEEIEYRFVRRDLVLVDIHASLVIDVLPGALPADDSRWVYGGE